jgi:hypothetical protein
MKIISQIFLFCIPVIFFSCSPEKKYQYEVNPVTISKTGSEKNNHKSTTEFISIAYSDLFGASIPQSKLINLSVAYNSFGDLKVIEERIIKNLLNDSSLVLPSTPSVNGDTTLFIDNCYKKFYNREPDEFEKYYWITLLRNDYSVSPGTVYYALMTSDEYRFY